MWPSNSEAYPCKLPSSPPTGHGALSEGTLFIPGLSTTVFLNAVTSTLAGTNVKTLRLSYYATRWVVAGSSDEPGDIKSTTSL
jgi:hypothetical protein